MNSKQILFYISVFVLLTILSHDVRVATFSVVTVNGDSVQNVSDYRAHNLSFKSRKTKVTKQKFADERDNRSSRKDGDRSYRRQFQLTRKQYGFRTRSKYSGLGMKNPSNWKLDWNKEWDAEFSAGLATMHVVPDGKHVSSYLGHGVQGRFAV